MAGSLLLRLHFVFIVESKMLGADLRSRTFPAYLFVGKARLLRTVTYRYTNPRADECQNDLDLRQIRNAICYTPID